MSILRSSPSDRQVDVGLLVLRLVLGFIFIMHGGQKLFVYGLEGVSAGFEQSGIPLAGAMAPLVAGIELLGGLAIMLGLVTRLAGLGIAAVMVGAIMFVHAPAGFFAPTGYEFPLALLAMAATLVATGAGAWSMDAVLERRTVKPAAESVATPRASTMRHVA